MAQYGSIESPRITQRSRPIAVRGRLFSFGDSLSTIRKGDQAGVSVNGRFSSSGFNWLDYFRLAFNPMLEFTTATSWAYEGAYATRDISGQAWSIIQPIPSFDTQITTCIAAFPSAGITDSDVAAVYFGTNDSSNYAGGSQATAASFSTAIVNGLNRLIGHGFRNVIVLYPESRYFSGAVPGVLQPQLDTIQASNRTIKLVTVTPSSAVGEFASPYVADGTHYIPRVHERLGRVAASQFFGQMWDDRSANFEISNKGSSVSAARTIGFTNFDAAANTGSVCRFELAGSANSFEAHTNQRVRVRSYNGLEILGAWEGNTPPVKTGGGKVDPCVRIAGNFWEHEAILRLESVPGASESQTPLLIAASGLVDRVKVKNNGETLIAAQGSANPLILRSGGGGYTRIVVDDLSGGNAGFSFRSSNTDTWAVAAYSTGITHHIAYFNYGLSGNPLAFGCHGPTNRAVFGSFQWDQIDPSARLEVQAASIDPGAALFRCVTQGATQAARSILAEVQANGAINTVANYRVGGTQVIGPRITGYAQTNVGGSRAAISTGSGTAQIAALLIQLVDDLKTHGIIGG